VAYEFIDHTYDVSSSGRRRGLRARSALPKSGLSTACITKLFPTRSHTVAAQGGITPPWATWARTMAPGTMYDTVKGSDWLGDRSDRADVGRRRPRVIELEHYGVRSRTEAGRIYQRPFGRLDDHFGKGIGSAPAPRRTAPGHASARALSAVAAHARPLHE